MDGKSDAPRAAYVEFGLGTKRETFLSNHTQMINHFW